MIPEPTPQKMIELVAEDWKRYFMASWFCKSARAGYTESWTLGIRNLGKMAQISCPWISEVERFLWVINLWYAHRLTRFCLFFDEKGGHLTDCYDNRELEVLRLWAPDELELPKLAEEIPFIMNMKRF